MSQEPVGGLRICGFESRRSAELRMLIEKQGGQATVAPSMQEIPLEDNRIARAFGEDLLAGRVDVVVLMTGVGTRALAEVLDSLWPRERWLQALARCCLVVRGPKPAAVLREWQVPITHLVPEPNTWKEVLDVLDEQVPLPGRTVAVQEYGLPSAEFYAALTARGAHVQPVPVYRWALPDDTQPLRAAIHGTCAGAFDVLLFTSAFQLHNVREVARQEGCEEAWLTGARRCVIASIGPTASEALEQAGLQVDIQPEHGKMGQLVLAVARQAPELVAVKRAGGG